MRTPPRTRDDTPGRWAWLAKDTWEADVRVPARESTSHDRLQVRETAQIARSHAKNSPIIVSADDRDYCDVTHTLPLSGTEIHEITVKSFSPARHISRPGFHLLSLSGDTHTHAHVPCLLPRADSTLTRIYIPFLLLTALILLITHMRRASRAARLHLTTPASPLPSITDPKWPGPAATAGAAPSPYSASSAYSYSYAYSNTPPTKGGSKQQQQQQARRPAPAPLVLPPIMQTQEEEDEQDAHYSLYNMLPPPASPVQVPGPADLLARRAPPARAVSPDMDRGAATGPPPRPWLFNYAFTFRGRRRRVAIQAPAWWPRRHGTSGGGAAGRRRRRREEVWSAAGRDLGRAIGPAIVVWVMLLWSY